MCQLPLAPSSVLSHLLSPAHSARLCSVLKPLTFAAFKPHLFSFVQPLLLLFLLHRFFLIPFSCSTNELSIPPHSPSRLVSLWLFCPDKHLISVSCFFFFFFALFNSNQLCSFTHCCHHYVTNKTINLSHKLKTFITLTLLYYRLTDEDRETKQRAVWRLDPPLNILHVY